MRPKKVLTLGRNPGEVRHFEHKALRARFGKDLIFERIDASDSSLLREVCEGRKPFDFLLLPPEKPTGGNKDHVNALESAIHSRVVHDGIAVVLSMANDRRPGSNLGLRLGMLLPVNDRQQYENFTFDL